MLDSQVDGPNVEGRSEALAAEDRSNSPNLQTQQPDVEASNSGDSCEVDCSLPDLPLKTLMFRLDFIERLREQGQVRNLLGFQPSSHLEPAPEIPEDDMCPVPYFIPELEMSCASAEAGQVNELTSASLEDPNALEIEPDIVEPSSSSIEEVSVPRIEEQECRVPEIKEAPFTDINLNNFEEVAGPSGAENVSEPLVTIPEIQEPSSPIIIAQEPTQIEEPIAAVIDKPNPGRTAGIISSMIGLKPILRPSVRLCFGDREQRRKDTPSQEEIKQQASIALKSLILSIRLLKKFEASFQGNFKENKLNQLDRIRSSLTYSRVFRQNLFQPASGPENRQGELPKNAMAGGEPVGLHPVIRNEGMRGLFRLDASDGWASRALDSDSSECSDSDDSGINNSVGMRGISRELMKMKRPIADRQDIEDSGRILFSQPVKLFRFNSAQRWQPEGLEHPYTGDIKILERDGKYYILLREQNTGHLLVYTRVDGSWHIGYMANRTNSCGWFNFNYAYCPEGTPEHFACTFQEPSHAAEFVARVRNLVIKCRLVCSP